MKQYIDKSALVAEIKRRQKEEVSYYENGSFASWADENHYSTLESIKNFLDTLEVKDLYEQYIQYNSIKAGIKAHAETYSFNIESQLFNQLTKEQQALWRKEIEQACISGGEIGVELIRDPRYKENLKVKEVDLEKELDTWRHNHFHGRRDKEASGEYLERVSQLDLSKHFFELGIKAQKNNIRHSMDETPNYPCDILFVTDVDNVFLFRYMENGRPIDRETPYFHNIQNGKCWYYCNDIINIH